MTKDITKESRVNQMKDDILRAEYNALRREIELLIEHQKDIMNFLILVFVAMVGLFGYLEGYVENNPGNIDPGNIEMSQSVSYVFLLFPPIFCLLILLYADKTIRILRAADYIHNYLRERICDLYKDENLLKWEKYKRHESSFGKNLALWLDRARWFIFIFPIFMSIVLFLLSYKDTSNILHDGKALFFLHLDLILVFIIGIWIIPRLEETEPIKDRKTDLNDC